MTTTPFISNAGQRCILALAKVSEEPKFMVLVSNRSTIVFQKTYNCAAAAEKAANSIYRWNTGRKGDIRI